jgi:hypothetical protein
MGPIWNKISSKSRPTLLGETKDGSPKMSDIGQTGTSAQPEHSRQQDLMSDLQRRLQDQERMIHDQEQTIHNQQANIKGMEEEEKRLQSQVWTLSDELNHSKLDADALRGSIGSLDEQLRSAIYHAQAANARIDSLNESCYENTQERAARSNAIQVLSTHNQKLQYRVAELEKMVAAASSETGTDLRSFFDQYTELKMAHDEITLRLKSEEKSRSDLHDTVQAMESESASFRTTIEKLEKEISNLEACQPPNLRSLLTLRLIEHNSTMQPDGGNFTAATDDQIQNWTPTGLSENSLDEICSGAEIQSLAKILPKGRAYGQFYKRLRLAICSVCSQAKFKFRLDVRSTYNSVKWLNEYPDQTHYFSCCFEQVCKECFLKHLLDALESKWWYKLGKLQWFSCPRDGCDEVLGIRCEADLQICLERYCGIDAEEHVKRRVSPLLLYSTFVLTPRGRYSHLCLKL